MKDVPELLSDRFWEIISLAQSDWTAFQAALRVLRPREHWQLYWTYRAAMGVLRSEEYQDYADPTLAEDALDELAGWIVAQGREFYMDIAEHPERMPPDTPENPYPYGHPLAEIVSTAPGDLEIPEDDDYFLL